MASPRVVVIGAGMGGLAAIPRLLETAPEMKILVLTQSDKEADVVKAITAGGENGRSCGPRRSRQTSITSRRSAATAGRLSRFRGSAPGWR